MPSDAGLLFLPRLAQQFFASGLWIHAPFSLLSATRDFARISGFFSLVFTVISFAAGAAFLSTAKRKSISPTFSPAITVLKPLKGADKELYENLASLCRQDYPRFEIICALEDAADGALAIVEKIRRDFSDISISTIFSSGSPGRNPKISNLSAAEDRIKTDFFLISDSDVRVPKDFLKRSIAPFHNPDIGLASCFYQITKPSNLWEHLEALSVNAQFLPQALVSAAMGMNFAMGAAMILRTKAFRDIGGFSGLSDHLADDFILSRLISEAGYRIAFSSVIVDSIPSLTSFSDYFGHQERWARTIRLCQPWGYLGTFLLHGFSLLTITMLLMGPTRLDVFLAAAILAVKCAGNASLSTHVLGSRQDNRSLFYLPLSEWLGFAAWFGGWKSTPVAWRGKSYKIQSKGRLVPMSLTKNAEGSTFIPGSR
ncbi:MAG: glycosyltransferase [Elusimicrobiota bacterium]